MNHKVFYFLNLLFLLFSSFKSFGQEVFPLNEKEQKWADSIYNSLTLEEKIGQLFMVAAYSNKDAAHEQHILNLVTKHKIGGLIFFQDNTLKQAKLTNKYQSKSKVPLMIGIDGEWGLKMRLKNTIEYPWAMAVGAVEEDGLVHQMGIDIGQQCKDLGIHVNFAPVADINTNPLNPIIGNRSYGDDKINIAFKTIAYATGMQRNRVISTGKHFPGHGDTNSDSHKTLPSVKHDKARLDSVEIFPFRFLVNNGITGMMVAHLQVPAMEPDLNKPASLSKNIVKGYLKDSLCFYGLTFTDALNMKGVANLYEPGEVDLLAFEAGNDVLLFPENVPKAIENIKIAIIEKRIPLKRLEESVKKIIIAKSWAGLNNYKPIDTKYLSFKLNNKKHQVIANKLVEKSITVVKNIDSILPIRDLKEKIAYIPLGGFSYKKFHESLNLYTDVDLIQTKGLDNTQILKKLEPYQKVIIGVHKSGKNPYKSYKVSESDRKKIQIISKYKTVILDMFTSPYSLLKNEEYKNVKSIVVSYQNNNIFHEKSAQIIFGALPAKGILPVYINQEFNAKKSIRYKEIKRLAYGTPEEVDMLSEYLDYKIDSTVNEGIKIGAFPGAQVLIARRGKVIFNKSYGFQTDKKTLPINNNSLYDIASITKVSATLPLIMKLYEKKKIDLNAPISDYLYEVSKSNKRNMTLKEILSHQAGLKAWIPFFLNTLEEDSKLKPSIYSSYKKTGFNTKVADKIYIKDSYKDTIFKRLLASPVSTKKKYRYSDLGYYMMQKIIEKNYNKKLDVLAEKELFEKLGAKRLLYKPRKKYSLKEIVPTEKDYNYRMQLINGYVHDQGAAMMGGVAGHAGLFSNANDLAKLMQMYLQKGYYGGKRYLEKETIDYFTKRHYKSNDNRRALGFDKRPLKGNTYIYNGVTTGSFGHSGFTGTLAWVDPRYEMVIIFLSNRVYPNSENRKLQEYNIRSWVQKFAYESITEYKKAYEDRNSLLSHLWWQRSGSY